MVKSTFNEYLCLAYGPRPPFIRIGQALFNALCVSWPELAEKVRGSEVDPFYDDTRIDAFIAFVARWWEAT